MAQTPELKLVSKLDEYFHQVLVSAFENKKVKVQPATEVYVLNLMNYFMRPENLFVQDGNGSLREEPLALLVKDALEEPQPEGQRMLFRRVGDLSLYTAGYFHERISRKNVGVSYYIDMGEAAYSEVASKVPDSSAQEVFGELASKFSKLVDVLADVKDKTTPNNEVSLLRLYREWTQTKNKHLEEVLIREGIIKKP